MNFDYLAERIAWVFGGLWFATLIAGVVIGLALAWVV